MTEQATEYKPTEAEERARLTGDYQTDIYMTQDEAELVISWAKEFYEETCLYLSENK